VKSKVAPPFKQVEFDILYNEGISKTGDLIDLGVAQGLVKKSGAWFTYEEERFQGREGFRQKLVEMTDLRTKLEGELRTKLGMLKDVEKKEEANEKQKAKNKKSNK
jgi:recombination protein RecA